MSAQIWISMKRGRRLSVEPSVVQGGGWNVYEDLWRFVANFPTEGDAVAYVAEHLNDERDDVALNAPGRGERS